MDFIFELTVFQCCVLVFAAMLIGFSKAALPGASSVGVSMIFLVFDREYALSISLCILTAGNIGAAFCHFNNVNWMIIMRLLPLILMGSVVGYYFLKYFDDAILSKILGVMLIVLAAIQCLIKYLHPNKCKTEKRFVHRHSLLTSLIIGVLAGFSSMIANIAGSVTNLYFFALNFNKNVFVATSVWLFFILNILKLFMHSHLGILSKLDMIPVIILSVIAFLMSFVGKTALKFVPEGVFYYIILIIVVATGINLLF